MIRKVEKCDYPEIARVMMRAFKQPPWNEDWQYQRAYQRIEQLDDGKYTRCYVYILDNKIVAVLCGKLITYVDDNELMIEDFYVDPDYQRQGIGGLLMEEVSKELDDVAYLTLLTGKEFYSVDFYRKNGFIVKDSLVFMYKSLK
ncbi:GNAT family N-acetyltransferase [uncultured Thomasclavelia sp.]|uniref:GNAT family N-acetyltransferase n=1 Tax=uncultured Thomasclavelia sp. TaxID=3025759 RepID=UPI0025D518CE|nr:GNAT family N-acetyltransferase [uncultured Thomasclavelia sp.]